MSTRSPCERNYGRVEDAKDANGYGCVACYHDNAQDCYDCRLRSRLPNAPCQDRRGRPRPNLPKKTSSADAVSAEALPRYNSDEDCTDSDGYGSDCDVNADAEDAGAQEEKACANSIVEWRQVGHLEGQGAEAGVQVGECVGQWHNGGALQTVACTEPLPEFDVQVCPGWRARFSYDLTEFNKVGHRTRLLEAKNSKMASKVEKAQTQLHLDALNQFCVF
jgi:hypothetical protein